jgi:phosphoribosylaminoimidazole-succinocarboxamide synthase
MTDALYESRLTALTRLSQGKVRDIYAIDDAHLLIITTDRMSAFDVVLPDPIPGKGEVLTELSNFWFARTSGIVANHLADLPLADAVTDAAERDMIASRATVAKRLKPLPIEAVIRGYLIGSGWKDYQRTGGVCGIALPEGLEQAQKLPEPIFTPATKAEVGEHDENISFAEVEKLIGGELAARVRELALRIYTEGAKYAARRGIIVADTKFEFGLDDDEYRTGISPPSFDKQYLRDYLETLDWNKRAPGPKLPAQVAQKTGEKYRQALALIKGPELTA